MFCCTLIYIHSSIANHLDGKRELIALLNLSSWCLVMVERLFLAMPRGCLQFVIVVFPDHTHLLFLEEHIFFISVILPIKGNFLCCHCFKHFSKSMILGSKFAWNISVQKVNLSKLASLELHLNFRFLGIQLYCVSCILFAKLAFLKFNLSSEILL